MHAYRTRGFNLIELMVVIAIILILSLLAIPNFVTWENNTKTRSVAESLQNGIRFAQGEAARLSRLTQIVTTSTGWSVSYVQIDLGHDQLATALQSSDSDNTSTGVTITPGSAADTVLEFTELGRVLASATSGGSFSALNDDAIFTIANPKGTRRLQVNVSPAGKVHMCDPDKTLSATTPDGC